MLALDPRVFEPVWEAARGLLPPVIDNHPLGCHRPRVDARQCFFGIVARLVTGASWETIGHLVGVSESTLLRRRNEWQRAGVFTRLAELALSGYDTWVGLRLDEISIDGSVHKAPAGGEGTGPSPVDRGKRGWKWSIASERNGIPVAWIPAAANTPDPRLLDDTLDMLDTRGYELEIQTAHLDRGYDSLAIRAGFADQGIDAHIAHRASRQVRGRKYGTRAHNKIPLGRRWKVERANSWLSNYGQLRRNTDRRQHHRHAALCLATVVLIVGRLLDWRDRWDPR